MIKVAISIDDVLREKTKKICDLVKAKRDPEFDAEKIDFKGKEYHEALGFKTKLEFNKFVYEDYALEIFGSADTSCDNLASIFNLWHLNVNNNEEIDEQIEVVLVNSMEYNASIGFTYFFLSRIASRVREVYLPLTSVSIWDQCDVLVTADLKLLETRPDGKVVVKIKQKYNEDSSFANGGEFTSFKEFIENENNLLNAIKLLDDGEIFTTF